MEDDRMRTATFTPLLALVAAGCGGSQKGAEPAPAVAPAAPAAAEVSPIPDGFRTLTPHVVVKDPDAAAAWYVEVFGAEKRFAMAGPDGKTMHAEIQIGDSVVMLSPEYPEAGSASPATLGGTAGSLNLYVEDVDAVFAKAVEAGATAAHPVQTMFWGDRFGEITDPFGHRWGLSTHVEVVPPEEIAARGQAWAQAMAAGQEPPASEIENPAPHYKPEGFYSVTAGLTVKNAAEAITFYQTAFGAKEIMRFPAPDGRIMHAMLAIGDSFLYLSDEFPEMGGAQSPESLGGVPLSLMIYVEDADGAFDQAIEAGAQGLMPVTDMFWGDRWGQVRDPYGHRWGLATHVEDLSPEEIQERMMEAMGQRGDQG
jgi:PhnB protein